MNEDLELLKLAAKAYLAAIPGGIGDIQLDQDGVPLGWNPLDCLQQAKRLRHVLKLSTGFDDRFFGPCAYATYPTGPDSCDSIMQSIEEAGGKRKALRLAMVRAAAEMARANHG